MTKRPPPKTTRMRVVLCGQCDSGRHDHCSKSPACECACKGSEVPPPQVTAEELAHAIKAAGQQPLPSAPGSIPPALVAAAEYQEAQYRSQSAIAPTETHVGKYVATSVAPVTTSLERTLATMPAVDKFPSSICVAIIHGKLYIVPSTIAPPPDGIMVATYNVADITLRKTVVEIRTTTLDLNDFITAPL